MNRLGTIEDCNATIAELVGLQGMLLLERQHGLINEEEYEKGMKMIDHIKNKIKSKINELLLINLKIHNINSNVRDRTDEIE